MLSSQKSFKRKSWRSNQFKNKLKPVKEPDSKLLPLLVMENNTLDSDGNVTNKFKEPLRALLPWLNSI
jgi:hypothetical protein